MMQGISKLAMGSALVVAVCLVLVFVLLLLLYVELCCSLLWQQRRRCLRLQTPLPTTATFSGGASPAKLQNKLPGEEVATPAREGWKEEGTPGSPRQKPPSTPTSAAAYYAHGVLHTPPSFFFSTALHSDAPVGLKKQGEVLDKTSLHFIGLIPSPSSATKSDSTCGSRCSPAERFVCISNPIYDGACGSSIVGGDDGSTPFETPDTSPSRLEMDEEEEEMERGEGSPPLKPMKKLPAVLPLGTPAACLADGRRSMATSITISATDTNRPSSSSSSNSPCTSPSW